MFQKLNISPAVLKAIQEKGYSEPTEIQARCIPLILEGKDIVGRSKTGSGKTLAFGAPAVDFVDVGLNEVQVLAVCPTRELVMQVADEINSVAKYKDGCKLVPVYGGADMGKQISRLPGARIIVATPGRLIDHIKRKNIRLDKVRMVVLDEADEMLNMGFRDDIEYILKKTPKERQTVMFSATMPPFIRDITRLYMKKPQFVEVGEENRTLTEIRQQYIKTTEYGKPAVLSELFKTEEIKSAIIFCNTKRMTDDIHQHLLAAGVDALALHGDMKQSERKRVMTAIKAHKAVALVATDVAARGIDISDIEYVINYDVPMDVEYYIHRIGRTGRAGKTGNAVTLVNNREELQRLNTIVRVTSSEVTEHPLSQDSEEYAPKKAHKGYMSSGGYGRSGRLTMDPRSLRRR